MESKNRYTSLDTIRGFTLISMILYHGIWDLVYIFGVNMPWYESKAAYIWQQSICWTFILLSGFCWSLGQKKLKRGLMVLGGSVLISLATIWFMPDSIILFGVLSLIGTSMLAMIPLDKVLKKVNSYFAGAICFAVFILTKHTSGGSLRIGAYEILELPKGLYANLLTAYLGFPAPEFASSDYFPIIPWIFLYMTGYFLYQIFDKLDWKKYLSGIHWKPLAWIGRHSLLIYMLHQPVVYGVLCVVFLFVTL